MRVVCMQIWDNITCIHVCRLPLPLLPMLLLCCCRLETISFECHHFACVTMSVYASFSLSAASRHLHCVSLCVCLHVKIIYVPQFTSLCVRLCAVAPNVSKDDSKFFVCVLYTPLLSFSRRTYFSKGLSLISQFSQ